MKTLSIPTTYLEQYYLLHIKSIEMVNSLIRKKLKKKDKRFLLTAIRRCHMITKINLDNMRQYIDKIPNNKKYLLPESEKIKCINFFSFS